MRFCPLCLFNPFDRTDVVFALQSLVEEEAALQLRQSHQEEEVVVVEVMQVPLRIWRRALRPSWLASLRAGCPSSRVQLGRSLQVRSRPIYVLRIIIK